MKARVIKLDRSAPKDYKGLASTYQKRLRSYIKAEDIQMKWKEERGKKDVKEKLGLSPSDLLISVDERGKSWSSPDFAKELQKWKDDPRIKGVAFVVGSPYGLPDSIKEASDYTWSLSNAVFPSDIAWLIVWEQLYRAMTIIHGTPYHHD